MELRRISLLVHDWLDMVYSSLRIEFGYPTLWPPQSLDFTQIDFSLWVNFKDLVYQAAVNTKKDLVAHRHGTCTSVNITLLRSVHSSITQRVQACLDMQDGHLSL
ncbi:hypothetical protein TNCV_4566021 [Trichonephila clavipes]|nr:hypothetical protein TNCV_4566021 [Trichonephila clavipes]